MTGMDYSTGPDLLGCGRLLSIPFAASSLSSESGLGQYGRLSQADIPYLLYVLRSMYVSTYSTYIQLQGPTGRIRRIEEPNSGSQQGRPGECESGV